MKKCNKCQEIKSFSEFHNNSARSDGLSSWCKNCNNNWGRSRDKEITKAQAKKTRVKNSYKPALPLINKRCGACRLDLNIDRFSLNKTTADGYQGECKECRRNSVLKNKFGISTEKYNQMAEQQGNMCAICGTPPTPRLDAHGQITEFFDVDHDHITKEVRGLLCNSCNKGIGLLSDNIETLESAVVYLTTTAKVCATLHP